MRILLFGATGMVGGGVLRECLLAPDVERVQTIGRSPIGMQHAKLADVVRADLMTLSEADLTGFDACFFCLGVSSAGMKEEDYRRLTFDLTLKIAEALSRLNPGMTFVYVSGAGTDEQGRATWARVKGKTENALLRLPFKGAYMFRPGLIQPVHGARSKTRWYRVFYAVARPLLSPMRRLFPDQVLTTEQLGRAMLVAAREGASRPILESRDIRALAEGR
jgi:uncharacterized protein YbjT (DUF2867 family)